MQPKMREWQLLQKRIDCREYQKVYSQAMIARDFSPGYSKKDIRMLYVQKKQKKKAWKVTELFSAGAPSE